MNSNNNRNKDDISSQMESTLQNETNKSLEQIEQSDENENKQQNSIGVSNL